MPEKVLIITGDAGESYETLYAKHRMAEAGYTPVIASTKKGPLNLVMHDFEPGWDTYVERPGYKVSADLTFKEIQILVAAGLAEGRKLTCYEHVKSEVTSAGGEWIGQESVRDGKFVSAQTWISHPDFYRHVMQCLEGR